MRSFFRLLLWLSITVLSFQGGTAMAIGQPDRPAHETMVMASHQHHQDAEQAGAEHCSKAGSKVISSHAKCATCTGCCVSTAAPPALSPTFHAPPFASLRHAIAEAAMTSFVPSTLERPPRLDFV